MQSADARCQFLFVLRAVSLHEARGYELVEKHFTMHGKQQLQAGQDPESLAYNAVLRPRPASRPPDEN